MLKKKGRRCCGWDKGVIKSPNFCFINCNKIKLTSVILEAYLNRDFFSRVLYYPDTGIQSVLSQVACNERRWVQTGKKSPLSWEEVEAESTHILHYDIQMSIYF